MKIKIATSPGDSDSGRAHMPGDPSAQPLPGPNRPPAETDWTQTFTAQRLALLIIALLFAAYPEILAGTHSFYYNDFGLFTYPVADYTHRSVWRGELPLWNPLSNCGVPFLAQWNTTVCYPFSWIYILLPLPWSLNYFCLGHLVLAGVGMHRLAYRWTGSNLAASVAGLAFAFNGLSLNCLIWTSNLAALCWMPSCILAVETAWRQGGRFIPVAAFVTALQMLSGSPEIILLTWILLGSLWLTEAISRNVPPLSSARRLTLVGALTAGLSALQLLPFFELVRHSDRDPGPATNAWAMPPWGWANLILPRFRTSTSSLGVAFQAEQQWTTSYYLGIGVVALAIFALRFARQPRIFWLAGATVLGSVLALGNYGFVYPILLKIIPPLGLVRYPIKYFVPAVFALPLLAGFAVRELSNPSGLASRRAPRPLLWIGGGMALLVIGLLWFARWRPHPGESWNAVAVNGVQRLLFLGLLLAGFASLPRLRTRTQRITVALALLVVTGMDVLSHTPKQNPTISRFAYGPLSLEMSEVPRPGVSRAMLSASMQAFLSWAANPDPVKYFIGERKSLFENANLIEEVPKVNGFFSLNLRDQTPVTALFYTPTNFPNGLADFLGVSQISSPREFFRWVPRDTALPLVTAGQTPVFGSKSETLAALGDPNFNPRESVFLPPEAQPVLSVTNRSQAAVVSFRFSSHEISGEVNAKQAAMVVVAQSWYTAWRATVDGKPTRLWRANHAFQAFEVPSGSHHFQLKYRDHWFHAGLLLSSLTALGCGAALLFCVTAKRTAD